jgi:hypothetical protein
MNVPSVKSIIESLPPDSLLKVQFQAGTTYLPGDEVVTIPGKNQIDYYVCTTLTKSAAPGAGWQHMGGVGEPRIHHTAVVADGSHNPIWFAPITGLGVEQTSIRTGNGVNLQANGNGGYARANQTIVPPGSQTKTVSGETIKLGRPFFGSAGEDSDFSKGDDNHYSFEQ